MGATRAQILGVLKSLKIKLGKWYLTVITIDYKGLKKKKQECYT
jgi:hypothetical protein